MQTATIHEDFATRRKLKQVKVDNWGTFFLQRLLQLYFNEELLDLKIKFHSNDSVLNVHRLVVTACTDYFVQLEQNQNESDLISSCTVIMPLDMPYECVKSIISFMYTGQLEYWTSEHNALYRTAQKMNMSVLTKLLDAQMNNTSSNIPISRSRNDPENAFSKQSIENFKTPTLTSQSTFERKLPVWKRKLDSQSTMIMTKSTSESYSPYIESNCFIENSGGPSRFDLPEVDDLTLGVFSSFDDITYNTKPIIQAPEKMSIIEKINNGNSLDNIADMFLTINNDVACVNIHDHTDNSSDEEWTVLNSVLKYDDFQTPSLKKVKFNFDQKENLQKNDIHPISATSTSSDSVENHAKIIREVLKKYPHLVQNNKNIRLKIMQKESKNMDYSTAGRTRVSYVILKSDFLLNSDGSESFDSNKDCKSEVSVIGPWECLKCNLNEQYTNYHLYRNHMQDVHGEKFDPRICEYCGYKATKRNILMYHMYTKHDVYPPKNMSFPKCNVCSYVALSESLLIRHKINHKHQSAAADSEFVPADLIQYTHSDNNYTNSHNSTCHDIITDNETSSIDKRNENYCLYCDEYFKSFFNLRSHMVRYHKKTQRAKQTTSMPTLDDSLSTPETSRHIDQTMENTFRVNAYLKTNERDVPEFLKSQKNDQDSRTDVMINSKDHQTRTLKKDFSVNILTNNELVHNPEENLIFCIQKSIHQDSSQKSNSCDEIEESKCLHHDTEIVEEVVEELESMGNENLEEETSYKKYKNLKLSHVGKKKILCNKKHFDTMSLATPYTDGGEVVQYVEEETEILEYETCNI